MRLKRIEARNWRQYPKIDQKFKTGITGIFGPNGCGKTNMLRAVRFNLTGEWGDELTKEGNIYDQMPEDEKSYVLCDWEHDGTDITITRNLPDKQSLIVGDRTIKSAAEITLFVTELLGMSTRLIQELVFVQQGDKMFDFLTAKPEERAKAYAHLCGTEDLEKLWKQLGDQIAADQHLAAVVVDNSDSLQNQWAELNKRLSNLGDQSKEVRKSILKNKDGKGYKTTVKQWRRWEHLQEEIKKLTAKIDKRKPKVKKLAKALERMEQTGDKLQIMVDKGELQAQQYKRVKERMAETAKRQQRVAELQSIVNAKPPEQPKEPKDFEPVVPLRQKIKDLTDDLAEAREVLKVFADSGVVKCPTCGTNVAELRSYLAGKQNFVNTNASKPGELRIKLAACEAYDKKKLEWDRAMVKHDTTTSMAQSELDELTKSEAALEVPADLDEYLENYDRLKVRLKEAIDTAHAMEVKQAARNEALKTWMSTRTEYEHECDGIEATKESAALAEERLQAHRQALAMLNQINPQIDSVQQDLKRITLDLAEIQIAKDRSAAGTKWVADLNAWREVVHRDNLQRIITQSYLEELVEQINEKLDSFDGPFRVSPADDLTMTVHKPNGSKTPSTSLSGGQKVVLAIAYRMAVNPGEMLVLDEPTAGLDTHNLGCLIEVLDNLRGLTKKQGRQIIMVTHDERLERVLDRVIRL